MAPSWQSTLPSSPSSKLQAKPGSEEANAQHHRCCKERTYFLAMKVRDCLVPKKVSFPRLHAPRSQPPPQGPCYQSNIDGHPPSLCELERDGGVPSPPTIPGSLPTHFAPHLQLLKLFIPVPAIRVTILVEARSVSPLDHVRRNVLLRVGEENDTPFAR